MGKLICGLLGETLGHSYSPRIHALLGDYAYELYEKQQEELPDFLLHGNWDGLNVTMPYKKTVVPYCARLSETAARLNSVNTLLRLPDGSLYGDNTDFFGFERQVLDSGIRLGGKKALVLGSGGASVTVKAVLEKLGAQVTVISRHGPDNYETLSRHADARIIANTTPLGMFPHTGRAAVDLRAFPACEGVLDVVYNPARTALLLQAEALGLPHAGGLRMLVAQAKRSSELFTGRSIPDGEIDRVEVILRRETENLILIGMPGCGKSRVAALLAQALDRPLYESDREVEKAEGRSIPEIFAESGEEAFRQAETRVLEKLGKLSGAVISTGGGCVTREENYPLLHQNGRIVWLERDLDKLARDGRPLSLSGDLGEMFRRRAPLYARFADSRANNNAAPEAAVRQILEAWT